MQPRKPTRTIFWYLLAAVVSWLALAVVGALQPWVGFLPILLIPAVMIAERYWGLGPAIMATVFCTCGALLLMRQQTSVPEEVHSLSNLIVFPVVAAILLTVMEGRRKQQRLGQERLIELSTLLESMPEAVFIFSPSGDIVDVNSAGVAFSGIKREDLLKSSAAHLARQLGAESQEKPVDVSGLAVTRALRGIPVNNEPRLFTIPPHNAQVEAMVSASPMRVDGTIIGALVVIRDVTEISHLQRRIADTERHSAIGQMAAGIAHDFNNVLDTISQATAVLELRGDKTGEERKVVFGMINNAVNRGTEIINRVREYIRGGTGQQTPVDVRRTIEEALELTRPMWRNVDKKVEVVRELAPVPMVMANAADLRRVFANLIINAIQAMPTGGTITVKCEENNGQVIGLVRDTGVGIPPDAQKKIFMPYFTTKTTGTGLGLSVAQKIIVSQRGNLTFTSEPGQGTTFRVELPAVLEPVREAQIA
ncbi:MAG: PAS domain S-box protein [Acidobacteria bacterium]|nr:PAS domain S-box protein [Acidobacteriota bacterium]